MEKTRQMVTKQILLSLKQMNILKICMANMQTRTRMIRTTTAVSWKRFTGIWLRTEPLLSGQKFYTMMQPENM